MKKRSKFNPVDSAFLKSASEISDNGCWNWKKTINSAGYGNVWFRGKLWVAHRVSFLIFRGEFNPNRMVCHTCDNRKCINPEHLFLGDAFQNCQDAIRKGRAKITVSRGEASPNAKLSWHVVGLIRKSSLGSHKLSQMLGLRRDLVVSVKNNRVWREETKHLPQKEVISTPSQLPIEQIAQEAEALGAK